MGKVPDIARMDYDDLAELEEALDSVIECRKTEEKFDLLGMDRTELNQLRRNIGAILDAMDDAEESYMNAAYERSV